MKNNPVMKTFGRRIRREDVIVKYVAGKDVLDVGGVDHYAFRQKIATNSWLHAFIAQNARSCKGIDILEARVREATEHGYNFEVGNAEHLCFESSFDVVVAGELVEHLYNMGLFLDGAWKALRPAGHLLITTPNAYSLSGTLHAMLRGIESCHPEHTCQYSPQTLSYIASKHGFRAIEIHVLARTAKNWGIQAVYDAAARWRPLVGEVLVFVLEKEPEQRKYTGKW